MIILYLTANLHVEMSSYYVCLSGSWFLSTLLKLNTRERHLLHVCGSQQIFRISFQIAKDLELWISFQLSQIVKLTQVLKFEIPDNKGFAMIFLFILAKHVG